MPVKTFRALGLPTGDNTAFGLPSEVIVTSCQPATKSSNAESLALAARTGIVRPIPGNATASRNSIGPEDTEVIFKTGLRCLYSGNDAFVFIAPM